MLKTLTSLFQPRVFLRHCSTCKDRACLPAAKHGLQHRGPKHSAVTCTALWVMLRDVFFSMEAERGEHEKGGKGHREQPVPVE